MAPIIERELQCAARRWTTYWTRLVATGAGLMVATLIVAVIETGARLTGANGANQEWGPVLFAIFKFLAMVTSMSAGWFFAADAIAQERREGTLELLFLAPLRPRDVVFGKLVAVSWRGTQWLLAMVPLFTIPVIWGGIQGRDVLLLAALAVNTLLWSMTTGLWASSRSRGVFESIVGTAATQVVCCVLPFLAEPATAGFEIGGFPVGASLLSPLHAWILGSQSPPAVAWTSLACVHGQAWVFFALAVRATSRRLRPSPAEARGRSRLLEGLHQAWNYGTTRSRENLRRRLLVGNPVRWWMERDRGPGRSVLVLIVVLGFTTTGLSASIGEPGGWIFLGRVAQFILSAGLVLLFALQASRVLVEARRTGALELLLVSPQSSTEILRAQRRSLVSTFGLPILLLAVVECLLAMSGMHQLSSVANAGTATPLPGVEAFLTNQELFVFLQFLVTLTGYLALAWVGPWMAMLCRQPSIAFFATLFVGKLVPWFVVVFIQASLFPFLLSHRWPLWIPTVVSTALALALNLGLFLFARHQLLPDLRRILDAPAVVRWPAWGRSLPPVLPS